LKQLFGKQPFWYPRRVPRMTPIIKQFSPIPNFLISSCVPIVPQPSILDTFNPFSSLSVICQILRPYKQLSKIMV
jgi:hypothetical protein